MSHEWNRDGSRAAIERATARSELIRAVLAALSYEHLPHGQFVLAEAETADERMVKAARAYALAMARNPYPPTDRERQAADELVTLGQEIERTVARDGSADYERPRTRDDVHRVRKHTTSPIGDPDVEPSCDHVMRVRGCVACDLKWANAGPL